MSFSDIIDVQVLLTDPEAEAFTSDAFVREVLACRPSDRDRRHAWQESAAELLEPELERVAQDVLERAGYRVPATPAGTQAIESALSARLMRLGVDDVFAVAVRAWVDYNGCAHAEIRLGPTKRELSRFGFFRSDVEGRGLPLGGQYVV